MRFAVRAFDTHEQHVLREPALGSGLVTGNPERVTFLAEQCVAAVAGAETLDRQFFREMHDEAPLRIEFTDRMQPLHEAAISFDARERLRAHPRHDLHVHSDIRAVSDFHAAT